MLRLGAAVAVLGAACSPQQRSKEVDIANAARAAQQSLGDYVEGQAPPAGGKNDDATAVHRRAHPPATDDAVAHYRCDNGTTFRAAFDDRRDIATLRLPTGVIRLNGKRPASGIWYAGQGYDLRGKGKDATLTPPESQPLACRVLD